MIRRLLPQEFNCILEVINDAARAYKGVIPDDRWNEPYMPAKKLKEEINSGVEFFGWQELTKYQRKGIGTRLLKYLVGLAQYSQILVGTWKDATWAIRFYEKHGFKLTSPKEKDRLLRKYWDIPQRQIEVSVVLRFSKK